MKHLYIDHEIQHLKEVIGPHVPISDLKLCCFLSSRKAYFSVCSRLMHISSAFQRNFCHFYQNMLFLILYISLLMTQIMSKSRTLNNSRTLKSKTAFNNVISSVKTNMTSC